MAMPKLCAINLALMCGIGVLASTLQQETCTNSAGCAISDAPAGMTLLQTRLEWALSPAIDSQSDLQEQGTTSRSHIMDTKLELPALEPTASVHLQSLDIGFSRQYVTNPCFLLHPDSHEVWTVMRMLSYPEENDEVYYKSDIVFGRADLSDFRRNMSTPRWEEFHTLPDPRLLEGNVSECNFRIPGHEIGPARLGPEDPKLFTFANKVYLMFVGPSAVAMSSLPSTFPRCPDGNGVHMHVVEVESFGAAPRFGSMVSLHMAGMSTMEKGWSMFTYISSQKEHQLLSIYSIHPHVVLSIDLKSGEATKLYEEYSAEVARVFLPTQANITDLVHGGGGVVRVDDAAGPYYLSVLHYFVPSELYDREYHYHPYKFSAEPPFSILSVSSVSLPLLKLGAASGSWTGGITYVSSVAIDDGHVLMGYGQGDEEARVYRQSLDAFEQMFF